MSPRIDSTSLYGTLNLLILKAVAGEPLHGLAIARRIRESSDDSLTIEEGALYPALHRLERDGLLEASWGTSENNRRAKFYALTAAGRTRLTREREQWLAHTLAVSRLLELGLEAD
ncbi:MAG: PadR family transcriptional regulator [Longimicrobiales bacterium]